MPWAGVQVYRVAESMRAFLGRPRRMEMVEGAARAGAWAYAWRSDLVYPEVLWVARSPHLVPHRLISVPELMGQVKMVM